MLLPDPAALAPVSEGLVGQQGIFFLRQIDDTTGLYRFVSSQGVFINVQGHVDVPLYQDTDFPADYEGRRFQPVLDEVRRERGRNG